MASGDVTIESINAVTLSVGDMVRSVSFYRGLGFVLRYGGEDAAFTSFTVGRSYLNLQRSPRGRPSGDWGRVIFHVSDVDALYDRVLELGYSPESPPENAPWGERFFHVRDPDGHELSFAIALGSGVR